MDCFGDEILVMDLFVCGVFVCLVGFDFVEGDVLLVLFFKFGYWYLVLVVVMNYVDILVVCCLKVVILVIGDELVWLGE